MKSGQALVLVMMVLSVALTVGLSVATRSTNEVKVTSAQEESARALEAAEAGLEKALGGTMQGTEVYLPGSDSTYVVIPTPTPGAMSEWLIPFQLVEGQVATVDLRNYTNSNASEKYKFRFCWGTNTSVSGPALEAVLYYTMGGVGRLGRVVFDPESRISSTLGSPWNVTNCPPGFKYSKKFDLVTFMPTSTTDMNLVQMQMLRFKMLFNGNNAEPLAIMVQGNGDFGRQGYQYTSIGSAGSSTQKVRGWDLNYDLPLMFDNAVFSGTSLSK